MHVQIRDPFGTVVLRGELEEVNLSIPIDESTTVRDQVVGFLAHGRRMTINGSSPEQRMLFDIEVTDHG